MQKKPGVISLYILCAMLMTGCSPIGQKQLDMSVAYAATGVISILILIFYVLVARRRDKWYLTLLGGVALVSAGYWALSVSHTIESALMANRVSYLGSVVLPLSMLMIITDVVNIKVPRYAIWLLIALAAAIFALAASPGYLDIYYREVTLSTINGATVLTKVYGPWHVAYLIYLVGYLMVTVGILAYSAVRRKLESTLHAALLTAAVAGNLGVWLIEQLVHIDFEMLAVSYIISEIFLIGIALVNQEQARLAQSTAVPSPKRDIASMPEETDFSAEALDHFAAQLKLLTITEKLVYQQYVSGCTSREIMEKLVIKENTLKYHNKNIYSKLGVSSRKQLIDTAAALSRRDQQ